jgi:hypothetical protein
LRCHGRAAGAALVGRNERVRRRSGPVSSVITAATLKDRIEADIQVAGAKPMA